MQGLVIITDRGRLVKEGRLPFLFFKINCKHLQCAVFLVKVSEVIGGNGNWRKK